MLYVIIFKKKNKGVIKMRYFKGIDNLKFLSEPEAFTKYTNKDILKYAIGANMYMPGTQANILNKLIENKFHDIGAITLCCEDAVPEEDVEKAETNIIHILSELYEMTQKDTELLNRLPLIFIRVRNVYQFKNLLGKLNNFHLSILAGFNFPKFNSENGAAYFELLRKTVQHSHEILYGMPILEDNSVIYRETRAEELIKIQSILSIYHEYVLNIRVGGTDFSSLFGLRRSINSTIYDIRVVSDCLTDILNYFARGDKGYVVSGPVWEYFSWNKNSPEIKGLIKELQLDIDNGFQGKTIIHPSQINVVNKSYIVKYAEYYDAMHILEKSGGVFKSIEGNRMNECVPHRTWANRIMARARIFGVIDKDVQLF